MLKDIIVGLSVVILASTLATCPRAEPNMPRIPSEDEKRAALLEAYWLNGNSMVRWGSIDLTPGADRAEPSPPRAIRPRNGSKK